MPNVNALVDEFTFEKQDKLPKQGGPDNRF